tara:strand:+ start:418 stop:723 length:306 start_codon:yes stop_codon:yes gene_type:complete
MKKFLVVLLLLVSASAFAQYRHPGYYGHRHGGGGNWVAPLIGGAILGAVITDAARANQPAPQPPIIIQQPIYQSNTYSCLVQIYDPITRTIKNEVMLCVNQ